MPSYFIDSNILIDIIHGKSSWSAASASLISDLLDEGARFVINPVVYAEISVPFHSIEKCSQALSFAILHNEPIPLEAAFLAGKAFMRYRRNKGSKTSPLPDFFIGAHAAVKDYTLVTRDAKRYKNYFPKLNIIKP